MVTGPARRYNVTISRLMPIYNGNGARQGAQQSLFVCQVEDGWQQPRIPVSVERRRSIVFQIWSNDELSK